MKKFLTLLVVAMLLLCTACSSNAPEQQTGSDPTTAPTEETNPEAELVQKLMDAIGPDMMARAKAANYQLVTKFTYYRYDPQEGWEPSENDYTGDILFIMTEVYAPKSDGLIGPASDIDLLRELQYAIIDSNIFDLTADEQAELKSISYSLEKRDDSIRVKDGFVELHFLELDSKVVLTIGNVNTGIRNNGHRQSWYRTYDWGELDS